jgi:hypothetical protein
MLVSLTCSWDELVVRCSPGADCLRESAVGRLPNVWLLLDQRGRAQGLRITGLDALCPYELTKVVRANAGSAVQAELPEVASGDCEHGPTRSVYLDRRGFERIDWVPAAEHGANVLVAESGVVVGIELFEPMHPLPPTVSNESSYGRWIVLVGIAATLALVIVILLEWFRPPLGKG